MAKVLINFTVEEHIVLAFKSRVPPRERSGAVERFMDAMAFQGETDIEEAELKIEIDSLRERLKETSSLLSEKSALYEMKKTQNKVFAEQAREEMENRLDSVKAFNPMDR